MIAWRIEEIIEMDSLKDSEKIIIENILITREYTESDLTKILSDKNLLKLTNIFVDADNPLSLDKDGVLYNKQQAGNPLYSDIDGVLFNKQQTALLCYPRAREDSEYVIPESVVEIGRSAFEYAASKRKADKGLKRVILPKGLKVIDENAFWCCSGIEELSIPAGVTTIGRNAFFGCSSLGRISVDPNNQNYCDIDGVLFTKDMKVLVNFPAEKKMSEYTVPEGVTTIATCAFRESKLESITVPVGVTYIGRGGFEDCWNLANISLPEGLTTLEDFLFSYCGELVELKIPSSVSAIGGSGKELMACGHKIQEELPKAARLTRHRHHKISNRDIL